MEDLQGFWLIFKNYCVSCLFIVLFWEEERLWQVLGKCDPEDLQGRFPVWQAWCFGSQSAPLRKSQSWVFLWIEHRHMALDWANPQLPFCPPLFRERSSSEVKHLCGLKHYRSQESMAMCKSMSAISSCICLSFYGYLYLCLSVSSRLCLSLYIYLSL